MEARQAFRGGVQGSLYPKLWGSCHWGIGRVLLYSNPGVWVRNPADSCSHRRGLSWEWILNKHLIFLAKKDWHCHKTFRINWNSTFSYNQRKRLSFKWSAFRHIMVHKYGKYRQRNVIPFSLAWRSSINYFFVGVLWKIFTSTRKKKKKS